MDWAAEMPAPRGFPVLAAVMVRAASRRGPRPHPREGARAAHGAAAKIDACAEGRGPPDGRRAMLAERPRRYDVHHSTISR